ncbi:Hypothetical predicted protein [Pelobates cultripes]|uniref:Lymphoid-restricted membrane protein n=1 Tax=Pelobates cultripes TaxID=61616 RepID=A0AAD1RVB2_PELCU|nr:Hypothetical predicted protein [Pelobates cultripes]
MSEAGSATKRHNPVDSICRKIKTIQMRDQDSNPNLQIPKFQSRNFDSPQSSTKKNLEEVLKNRTVKNTDRDLVLFSSPNYGLSPDVRVASPCVRPIPDSDSPLGNATYSINMASKEKFTRVWPSARTQSCSTPMVFPRELSFKYPQSVLPVSECRNLLMDDRIIPSTHSFYLADRKSETVPLQSPVVKRLSMSEAGLRRVAENKMEATSEVSLICEEDLLNSIFYACDTDHRGKVAVSKIVDYLRHTTSRGSEDSGLDELCNMLDPERQDISMDLDTYHAIMKEWIDDCRNNGADNKTKDSVPGLEDSMLKLREGLMAVRRISGTLNVTSGSLEAFGGDVSRGDLETSDLITCVADLQYNNQKLQEQHHKMKTTIEALEETNHRLVEENEELRSQWKSVQQSITRVRSLKDELEEMKISMSTSEEKKAQMAFQNKQLEKDNLSLIHKISSLQEENTRNMLEAEEMRKAISEFSDKIADLQLQLSDSETTFQKKDASLHMKDLYIEEMRSTLMEYNSVIENLRIEKTKLENSLQQMEQELLSNGIASPVTFKLNRLIAGSLNSLHSELELAQQLPEVSGDLIYHSGEPSSSLDITLDREVLLLLQGPGHEQLAAEFKAIVQNLLEDTCTMSDVVPLSLQRLMDSNVNGAALPGRMLEVIKSDLKEKRNIWTEKLKQLEKHKESMDKEFVKMAGNLRRIKTEQLHMRKELSSRLHELGTVRQQQEEAEGKAEGLLTQLQESSAQNDRFTKQIEELQSSLSAAWSQAETLKHRLEDAECEQRQLQATNQDLTSDHRTIQEQAKEQQKTIRSLQEKLFKGQLCGLLCQTCSDWDEGLFSTLNAAQSPSRKEKKNSSSKRFCIQDTSCLGRSHKTSLRTDPRCLFTPLLDALTLEILQLYPRLCSRSYPNARTRSPRSESSKHRDQTKSTTSRGALLIRNKWGTVSVGSQTDAGDSVNGDMDVPFEVLGSEHRVADNICRLDITSQTAADGFSSSLENTLISSEPDAELCVMEASDASGKERETAASEGSLDPDLQVESSPGSITTRTAVTEDTEVKTQQNQSIPNKEIPPAESLTGSLNATLHENHCSNSEKEMETEFLRLSLGFKCDLFTLDKRLRLEERSRDLAEENLKKEIASCVKLLEALTPLCEEDNQTYEIVKKLEKSLRFLSQHSARVASRAEMLGAIHQESRVSKAVDVMIQHVENLKRMYTKEHAELEELKELIQQNELPRPSTDRDELHKLPTSLNTKPPARRVSMPAYPRGMISGSPADLFGTDKLDGKIHKRSNSWKVVGTKHADSRPILQRFVANYTRTEPAEENSIKEDEQCTEIADDIKDEKRLSVSTESNLPPTETHSVFTQAKLWVSTLKNSVSNINKPMVISLLAALLLAVMVSFLTGLSFQQPVDGAPVGTGDSWTSIQQLFWPYTGLRHNGQPPV